MFDLDPVPELPGPQSPAVLAALERVFALRDQLAPLGVRYSFLLETLRDFNVVCQDLDQAESDYQRELFASFANRETTFDESEVASARVRARLINYFHHGHSLLDAIADFATGQPWVAYANSLEAGGDSEALPLARILTFRLREPRNLIAAHRKGWRAPVLFVGAGTASVTRRPVDVPAPKSHLVPEMLRAYETAGLDKPRSPSDQLEIAAWLIADRAPQCDESIRKLYRELIDTYGLQTAPVSRITPALAALIGHVLETS